MVETAGRSPDKLQVLAEKSGVLRDMAWPHVALAGGRIFCRDRGGHLKCLALAEAARESIAATPAPATAVATPAHFDLTGFPGTAKAMVLAWVKGAGKRRLTGSLTENGRYALDVKATATIDAGGCLVPSGGSFLLVGDHAKLCEAFAATGEITIEAIFSTDSLEQDGPARILTFSASPYLRNFTLGQEKDQLILRLRTTATGDDGMNPESVLAPLARGQGYHCLVTYKAGSAELVCYLNGTQVFRKSGHVTGDFSNWVSQQLVVGNEAGDDPRPWLGRVEGFALFNRAMDAATADKRFRQIAK